MSKPNKMGKLLILFDDQKKYGQWSRKMALTRNAAIFCELVSDLGGLLSGETLLCGSTLWMCDVG
ncbi:hypothetical protein HHK36_019615 [Tetracentron sinense]|uniref:Uncharacterized protein n=1 Tax=Tetracentron sinense TaxID=13715 RepID=A0A834YXN6_TETSI|nr:hypothetical protein HHK36_019615 [Tetracentron sinense]